MQVRASQMEIMGSRPGTICADSGRGKKETSFGAVARDSLGSESFDGVKEKSRPTRGRILTLF